MDRLTYTYHGNRLIGVNDAIPDIANNNDFADNGSELIPMGTDFETHEYLYDDNGNMVTDKNKGMTIQYNHLNIPKIIIFDSGGSIEWTYDAAGNKVQKRTIDPEGTTTVKDYLGSFEYTNSHLEAFYHEEGRVTLTFADDEQQNWQYEYTLKDYLGNGRVYFADIGNNGTVEVLQESHYYPFGMQMQGISANSSPNNLYQYNGKELNADLGLYWSDYGARWQDPQLGRWWSVDPLAEKYPSESSFVYVGNNPIIFIDPEGRERIVVTGGEFDSEDRYKYNFVETSINQLNQYIDAGGDDPITWAVMNVGYSDEDIQTFQSIANDLGVGFQLVGSADELTNYINSKEVSLDGSSKARSDDKITGMSVFGHGFSGSAEFGFNQGSELQGEFSWGISDAGSINGEVFNDANICFYTCNAGTSVDDSGYSNSLIRKVAETTNSIVSGYWGRTDYATMNQGQGLGAKINRGINGFNTNGSISLPSPGRKSTGEPSILIKINR